MDTIIQSILPFLLLYKYWALFGITFIAALFVPIPPGTIIMASAAFAYQGYFTLGWVLVVAALGNIVGDNTGYWLARLYGHPILYKLGLRKVIESKRYQKIEHKVTRRPGFIIFISRFEVFTNLAVNIIAGLGQVRYRKFLLFGVIGEVVQVALYGTIGYMFGSNWETISSLIGRALLLILLLAVVLFIIFRKRILRSIDSGK